MPTTKISSAVAVIGDLVVGTINGSPYSPGGGGSVTTVSVATANGVSGSVANPTTTPAITLTLGAITPSSVAASGTVTGSNLSGTNTGDQTNIAGNAATATLAATATNALACSGNAATATSATSATSATTAGTCTGNAATATALQTPRNIAGHAFDGTAPITITAADVGAPAGSGTSTGTNTGDQTSVSGNAGTATALQTPRAINGVNFDGTAAITVAAAAGTLTGTTLAAGVTGSSLTSVGTLANLTVTNPIAGSITGSSASTSGNAATVTTNANLTGPITSVGNATTIADAELSALAGLTSAADKLPYFTGSGTASVADFTSAGRALVDDASAAAQVTTLGLDNTKIAVITLIIDGGGSAITTGIKGDLEIPFGCTINRATLLADQTGSIVVDIWKDTYANYPPTVLDTITSGAKPTITTNTNAQDSTLTGWNPNIAAGDTLRFNVVSCTSITRVTLSLKVTKT